jgi:putative colanic acid biosynthesis acetyltransferase WcaF
MSRESDASEAVSEGEPTGSAADGGPATGTAPAEPPRVSPYSARAKIGRVLWGVVSATVWRVSPPGWDGLRRWLLRVFGGRIGAGVRIAPSVRVEIPWNLTIGAGARVCEHAILYCLGPVEIGDATLVGPYAHLCAGTHDYTDPRFTLVREPIRVGSGCALLTASFVAPGVVVGDGAVLQPRAGLYRDAEAGRVYAGNPARPLEAEDNAGARA